jgi:hypothetical protein
MVTLSAMRTSYDAADSPNDMPRTTSRSTNGQIMGAGDAHLRRISYAGKIIATAFSPLATLPSRDRHTSSSSSIHCFIWS